MDGQKLEHIRNLAVEYISSPSEERRKMIFAEMELTAASIPYEPSKLSDMRQAYKLARDIMKGFTIDRVGNLHNQRKQMVYNALTNFTTKTMGRRRRLGKEDKERPERAPME